VGRPPQPGRSDENRMGWSATERTGGSSIGSVPSKRHTNTKPPASDVLKDARRPFLTRGVPKRDTGDHSRIPQAASAASDRIDTRDG
jgi:hypothetical protein